MSAGASDNQELLENANELLNLHSLDLKILLGFIVASLFVVLLVQLMRKLMRIGFFFPNSRTATPFLQTPQSKETTGTSGMAPEEQTAAIIERLQEVERMGKAAEANSNRMEALEEILRKVNAANTELRTEMTQQKEDKSAMEVKLEETLRKVDATNAELREEVTQLKEDAEELEDRLRNKDAELQGMFRELEQKQTEMQLNLTKVVSATGTVLKSPDNLIPLYRYFNGTTGDHLYTTNWMELAAGRIGYAYEGVACKLLKDGTAEGSVPLHRLCNLSNGDHFYTTTPEELGELEKEYKIEDVQGFAFEARKPLTVRLYRYFNGTSGDHFYTTNWEELGNGKNGYKLEKIACYVYRSSDI